MSEWDVAATYDCNHQADQVISMGVIGVHDAAIIATSMRACKEIMCMPLCKLHSNDILNVFAVDLPGIKTILWVQYLHATIMSQ